MTPARLAEVQGRGPSCETKITPSWRSRSPGRVGSLLRSRYSADATATTANSPILRAIRLEVRKGAIANGEVDAFFDEIARPLGDERLDYDLGIANAERRELRHDIEAREGGRGADTHHAGRRGLSRTDAGFRCLEIADESHGRFVKVAPGLVQTETAGGAHKKLRTEIFFERGNLFAD